MSIPYSTDQLPSLVLDTHTHLEQSHLPGRIQRIRHTSMQASLNHPDTIFSTKYPPLLGRQRQYGMRSLFNTSHQQWESNPRLFDLLNLAGGGNFSSPTPHSLGHMLPFSWMSIWVKFGLNSASSLVMSECIYMPKILCTKSLVTWEITRNREVVGISHCK